jgi:hypothetical protein
MRNSMKNLGMILAATAFATLISPNVGAEEQESITVRRYGAFKAGYEVTHTFTQPGWVYQNYKFNYQDNCGCWHEGTGIQRVWGNVVTRQYKTTCIDWPNSAAALPANAIKAVGGVLNGIGEALTPGQRDCHEQRQQMYIAPQRGPCYQNNSQGQLPVWQRSPQRMYGEPRQQTRVYGPRGGEQIPFGKNRHPDYSLPPAPSAEGVPTPAPPKPIEEPKENGQGLRAVPEPPQPTTAPASRQTQPTSEDKLVQGGMSGRVMNLTDLPSASNQNQGTQRLVAIPTNSK